MQPVGRIINSVAQYTSFSLIQWEEINVHAAGTALEMRAEIRNSLLVYCGHHL